MSLYAKKEGFAAIGFLKGDKVLAATGYTQPANQSPQSFLELSDESKRARLRAYVDREGESAAFYVTDNNSIIRSELGYSKDRGAFQIQRDASGHGRVVHLSRDDGTSGSALLDSQGAIQSCRLLTHTDQYQAAEYKSPATIAYEGASFISTASTFLRFLRK